MPRRSCEIWRLRQGFDSRLGTLALDLGNSALFDVAQADAQGAWALSHDVPAAMANSTSLHGVRRGFYGTPTPARRS
jgi:hypothetical protein